MPAFGIANNLPKFNPFSLERYLQPLERYGQMFNQMEQLYGALDEKASTLEKLRDSAVDADSYKEYKDFINTLTSARDSMYKRGISVATGDREKLMNIRRKFSQSIVPLQEAYDKREKEALIQYQAEMQNPYLKFSRNATETPLSAYKAGTPDIQVIDGTKLAQMASQMAIPIAKQIYDSNPDLVKVLPFKYQQKLQHGFNFNDFMAGLAEVANGDPQSPAAKAVSYIQNTVLDQSGLNNWDKKRQTELRPWAISMINSGLQSLMGETSIKDITDEYGMHEAEADNQFTRDLELERQKAALKGGGGGAFALGNGADYIYNEDGQDEARESFEKYKQYFQLDPKGNVFLNQAGRARYRREMNQGEKLSDKDLMLIATNPRESAATAAGYRAQASDFVKFIDTIGASQYIDTKGTKGKDGKITYHSNSYKAGKAYQDYMNSKGISIDGNNVKGTAVVRRTFDNATSDAILSNLKAIMSSDITPKHYDGKGSYINNKSDKAITKSEIINNNVRVQDAYVNEVTGDVVIRVYRVGEKGDGSGNRVATENGKTYNIVLPRSSTFVSRFAGILEEMRKQTSIYEKSKSKAEKLRIDDTLKGYRQALYQELGALGVLGKSEPEKYDPND